MTRNLYNQNKIPVDFVVMITPSLLLLANCEDVRVNLLMDGHPALSDQYFIVTPSGLRVAIFCDFYHSHGVSNTYLSPAAINVIDTTTLRKLHNRRLSNVNVRLLMADGEQKDYGLEQLSSFQNKYPLVVQINEAVGYWQPVNNGTPPFLYLGFQPAEAAPASTTDKSTNPMFGYRAGGVNFEFINCNQLPKSYFCAFHELGSFSGINQLRMVCIFNFCSNYLF